MRTACALLLLAGLASAQQAATPQSNDQSPFDGTWKADLNKVQFSDKPQVLSLKDGRYRCLQGCMPKVDVPADGQDHPVTGSPYYDGINVKVVDPKTVEFTMKNAGKTVFTERDVVSDDGSQYTSDQHGHMDPNGPESSAKVVLARVNKGPEGAHLLSGAWRPQKVTDASDSATMVTFKSTDNGLDMSQPNGASYSAKFDGKDYPFKGDPGTTSVSLRRIDARHIQETDKRGAKTIAVVDLTVAPDGRTMTTVVHDKVQGTEFKLVSNKQ